MFCMRSKWRTLSVTNVISLLIAALPIKRSKSSTGVPFFLSLAFSLQKTSMESAKGIKFSPLMRALHWVRFCSLLLEHSAPYLNSATVTSEM